MTNQLTAIRFILTWLVSPVLAASGLHAASGTWNGTTSAAWSLAGNWSASPVPGSGDTATFNNAGNGNTTLDLGAGVTIKTLLFDTANATAYTIGTGAANSQTLTLNDSGVVTMNSTVTNGQLVNATLTLGTATAASYTLTDNSTTNTLTFAGKIQGGTGGTAGAKTLNISGASSGPGTVISGNIANGGAAALAVTTGSGVVTFSGSNSFTGMLTVNNNASGSVTLANNYALAGSSGVNFNGQNGTPLYLAAGTTISGITFTNSSGGNGGFGVSGNGVATWDGNIINNAASWGNPARYGPNSAGGIFVIGTGASETMSCSNGFKVDWNPNNSGGSTIVNSTITGGPINSNNFAIKAGALYLYCTSNSFTAPTIDIVGGSITSGTLVVNKLSNQGLNSSIGAGAPAGGTQIINLGGGNSCSLQYVGTGDTTDRILQFVGHSGTCSLNQSGSGDLTLAGNILSVSGNSRQIILTGSTSGRGIITGNILEATNASTSLCKTGSGTWILAGSNNITGGAQIQGGTVLVNGWLNGTMNAHGQGATAVNVTFGGTGTVAGAVSCSSSYGYTGHVWFTLGSPMTFLSSLNVSSCNVYLTMSNNVPAGTYTLATYSTAGSSVSFSSTPVIMSGSLVSNGTANVTAGAGVVQLIVTTNAFSTSTLLTAFGNPTVVGSPVTFTAQVQTTNGVTATNATGNYVFKVDGTPVATNSLTAGKANYSTSSLSVGSHTITANYLGDANYLASAGNLAQTVSATALVTTTVLNSSANPSALGSSVTFTATVQTTNGITAGPATGNCVFKVDGSTVATQPLAAGQATFSTSALASGSHIITAGYAGDANYFSSTNSLTQTVCSGTPMPVFFNGIGAWVEDPAVSISTNFTLTANGVAIPVTAWFNQNLYPEQDIARFAATGSWTAVVTCGQTITNYIISPLSRYIVGTLSSSGGLFNNVLTFTVNQPDKLLLRVNGLPQFTIFALPQQAPPPANAVIIPGGFQNWNTTCNLSNGETLWLSPGSYVQGAINAYAVNNVTIAGYGIIQVNPATGSAPIFLQNCANATVAGILILPTASQYPQTRTTSCTNTLWQDVCLMGMKEIRESCSGVTMSNCFMSSIDDALSLKTTASSSFMNGVTITGSTGMSHFWGTCFSAGEETYGPKANLIFTNCDLICTSGAGGLVRNLIGNGGSMSNVIYANIRCEGSTGNNNVDLGNVGTSSPISDILFQNVTWANGNAIKVLGATNSIMVDGVTFENCTVAGSILTQSYAGLSTNAYVTNLMFSTSAADALSPVVNITSPANGTSLTNGSVVNVAATITDYAGVQNGQLYVDGAFKGTDTTAPYNWSVSGLGLGVHTLAVVGNNILGGTATNSVGITILAPTPPNFSGSKVSVLPGGNISLVATGAIGGTYKLWASTNLALMPFTNYATLLVSNSIIATSPFTNFDLTAPNYPQRFYLFTAP